MRAKIKPIIPKRVFIDVNAYAEAIEEALDQTAQESKADYEKTTRTWQTQVNFTINKTKYGRSIGTRNKIYGYVDQGTEPHIIRPRRAKRLRFATGGTPKTRINTIASYKGKRGTNWRTAMQVNHPGTKARNFTAVINTRNKRRLPKNMRAALKKAAQK